MNGELTDYRGYLRRVLQERTEKNPSYSLRAMAQQLKMAPSMLSEVLGGKRNLSLETAAQVAQLLRLSDTETEFFCLSVQIASVKSPQIRSMLAERMSSLQPEIRVQDLSVDLFRLISSWYHLPILELTYVEGFVLTASNVAKRLGITRSEAELAIDRLLRLELIEKAADGKYRKTKSHVFFGSEIPNQALRRYHSQMLEKAIVSLESQTPQEKAVYSETFAFDPELLPAAKKLTQDYLKRMVQLAGTSKKKTQVYHLNSILFRITDAPIHPPKESV